MENIVNISIIARRKEDTTGSWGKAPEEQRKMGIIHDGL